MSVGQVMLSVHCASMLSNAEKFRVFLTAKGYTVFLCNQMGAGVNYRSEICLNASQCKVFVAFMNDGWCMSKECEFEFNIALGASLENSGNGGEQVPYIIPILLEPFSFYAKYPAIRGFLRNANGIVVNKQTDINDSLWERILKNIEKTISPASLPPPTSLLSVDAEEEDIDTRVVEYPLLMYVSPSPNNALIALSRVLDICTFTFDTVAEFRTFSQERPEVLEQSGLDRVHILVDNAKDEDEIFDIFSGEVVARFVRGARCQAPILIYGNEADIRTDDFTLNYSNCKFSSSVAHCRQFIQEQKNYK